MLFVIEGRDKPGRLDTRLAARPDHLTYLAELGDQLVLAGPFLDDNEKPCGSLVVIKADDLAQAKAIAGRDPYITAGLFESTEVRRWAWAVNAPKDI